jgi:hypothetical protein
MTQYVIHSVVRSVHHRTHRATLPAALKRKQYVGNAQARLVPGARLLVDETFVTRNLLELRQKSADKVLEVRTPDGRVVDLMTMEPGPMAPKVPLINKRLDSVKYDTPTGQYIPPYVGDDEAMPQVLPPGQKPALLNERAYDAGHAAAAAAAEAVVDAAPVVDVDAAVDAAMADAAADDEPPAPVAPEAASSGKGSKKSRR